MYSITSPQSPTLVFTIRHNPVLIQNIDYGLVEHMCVLLSDAPCLVNSNLMENNDVGVEDDDDYKLMTMKIYWMNHTSKMTN